MSNTKEIIAVSIICGPEVNIKPGQRATVDADLADALLAGGYATLGNTESAPPAAPVPESAGLATPETTAQPAAQPKNFAKKR